LLAQGSELCLAIGGPQRVRNYLSERMWVTALCQTEVVGVLAVLGATVSSAVELVLRRSPDETFRGEVVDELVAEFLRL
jgi:hypothetical protein